MEVNLNVKSAGPAVANVAPQTRVKTLSGNSDAPQFSAAAALNESFGETPDIRPEAVDKARRLISQSSYPPAETVKKIAVLLAFNISREDQSL